MAESPALEVQVVHASPGRIRLKIPRAAFPSPVLRDAARALTKQSGVHEVRQNPTTGSVVIVYAPEEVSLPELFAAVSQTGVTVRIPEPPAARPDQEAAWSQSLTDILSQANRAVAGLTGGRADLRSLVPASLALLAARELVFGAGLTAVPWYALSWYAFDSFIKLQKPRSDTDQIKS